MEGYQVAWVMQELCSRIYSYVAALEKREH